MNLPIFYRIFLLPGFAYAFMKIQHGIPHCQLLMIIFFCPIHVNNASKQVKGLRMKQEAREAEVSRPFIIFGDMRADNAQIPQA